MQAKLKPFTATLRRCPAGTPIYNPVTGGLSFTSEDMPFVREYNGLQYLLRKTWPERYGVDPKAISERPAEFQCNNPTVYNVVEHQGPFTYFSPDGTMVYGEAGDYLVETEKASWCVPGRVFNEFFDLVS